MIVFTFPSEPSPAPDDTQPVIVKAVQRYHARKWFVLLVGALLVGITLTVVALAWPDSAPEVTAPVLVTLTLNGATYPVSTEAQTVAAFLQEQNLRLETGDVLFPALDSPVTAGMVIRLDHARTVLVVADGATSVLRTTFANPVDILDLAGQTVNPADKVLVDGVEVPPANLITWPHLVDEIVIQRAVPVRIIDGETQIDVRTTGMTVGDVLFEAGVDLFLADTVSPDVSAPVVANMRITIDRSRPLTVFVDGESLETRVNSRTVGDALQEIGIVLAGLDYTIPNEAMAILPGMSVRVVRVVEETFTEQESLPYEVVYQADASLPLDQRAVLQAGQTGILERTIRVRYENGIEIARMTEQEIMTRSPQNHVVGYGTQVNVRTLETPDGTMQYWRKLRMYATSYHPAAAGGSTATSTGAVLQKGIIAIDPRIVPYGTTMFIEGYGVGVAADTGGPRSNPYWVDLGYSDDEYVGWYWWVDVYLLLPVPQTINYLLPETSQGGPIP